MKTHNGDFTNYSSGNPLVEFFSKAGSLFEKKESFYKNEASALDLFEPAFCVSKEDALKLAFWCRDIRSGAGNRSGFRKIINWIANTDPNWISVNLHLIPVYGRWDDLISLCDTSIEKEALEFWAEAILRGDGLACKWAPRQQKKHDRIAGKLRSVLNVTPRNYRKLLVSGTNVVEQQMCSKQWTQINFEHVPSVAMSRYTKAFAKNTKESFEAYKVALVKGEKKVNASAIFPHDLFRTVKCGGDCQIADKQFESMPNFFKTEDKVMILSDFSGSMGCNVSGSIQAIDISAALSLYCSDRLGKENPFYRKFIPFSDKAEFMSWKDKTFSDMAKSLYRYNGFVGSTNIASAFELLLNTAIFLNVSKEQMPNVIIIISDMQFNSGVRTDETSVKSSLKKWKAAGYNIPKVIYWNTAGYAGSPVKVGDIDVGLVSGFSPSILKSVFDCEDFTPLGIMKKTIEKYKITIPE